MAKIIEYTVFQLSLSRWFVFIETSRHYLKNLDGPMERFNSPTKIIDAFHNKLFQISD